MSGGINIIAQLCTVYVYHNQVQKLFEKGHGGLDWRSNTDWQQLPNVVWSVQDLADNALALKKSFLTIKLAIGAINLIKDTL